MFIFNPEIKKLDIEVEEIVNLYRSANDMQVALPGHSSQRSSGFLCCYKVEKKFEVVAVFQLQEENQLGFYTWDQGSVTPKEVRAVLEEGLGFFETMGFMMGDMELGSFSLEESRAQWESFPLKKGLVPRPKEGRKKKKLGADDAIPPDAFQTMAGRAGDEGAGLEERELTPYAKCQPQRLKLCQKLGRLLASF